MQSTEGVTMKDNCSGNYWKRVIQENHISMGKECLSWIKMLLQHSKQKADVRRFWSIRLVRISSFWKKTTVHLPLLPGSFRCAHASNTYLVMIISWCMLNSPWWWHPFRRYGPNIQHPRSEIWHEHCPFPEPGAQCGVWQESYVSKCG